MDNKISVNNDFLFYPTLSLPRSIKLKFNLSSKIYLTFPNFILTRGSRMRSKREDFFALTTYSVNFLCVFVSCASLR